MTDLTPGQEVAVKHMTEEQLENGVKGACKTLGLRRYHTYRSTRSPAGFPDDVIVGPRGLLFRELKSTKGKVSPEQQAWLDDLTSTGQDAAVWRPVDWVTGRILVELRAIAKAP